MLKTKTKLWINVSILVILIISVLALLSALKSISITKENNYTWTKAICDDSNFCQDYLIECENKNVESIIPITGAVAKFSDDWKDPRSQEDINRLCN